MDALAVHEWVMEKAELPIATEDAEEGIAKLKAIRITLTGEHAIRNVQNAFIKIDEIIRHHRLDTSESEMIKWLRWKIGPEKV